MALSNAENQRNYVRRLKERAGFSLELGEDLEDGEPVRQEELTPLEYMLKIMNNPNVPPDRRDKMAIAAAQYLHVKADVKEGNKTKKDEKEEAADEASNGKFAPATGPRLVV